VHRFTGTYFEHFGHTSFAVARGGLKLLIDPVLVRQELDFRQATCPEWFFGDPAEFDAIIISHAHDDHLHPPTLLGFPEEMPIYYCGNPDDAGRLLSNLGFKNLHRIKSGDVLEFPEDVKVHVIHADQSSEGTEQCCLLVETPDSLILDAVDIKDSAETREALEKFRGKVDLAFVPVGASLQWQGYYNQMDSIHAVSFCEWLAPAKVAPCGGTLSFSQKPRIGTIERYPTDFADWLSIAGRNLNPDQLLRQRAPFRLQYSGGELLRCVPVLAASTYRPRNGTPRPQALLTTFFTGYDPQFASKRIAGRNFDLAAWIKSLDLIREVIANSEPTLCDLIRRCDPTLNRTPAATLLPSMMRHLVKNGEYELAAKLTAFLPKAADGQVGLELSFFALAEALIENTPGISHDLAADLRACLWIDRGKYQLLNVHRDLAKLGRLPEAQAQGLANEHIEELHKTIHKRRPMLAVNHLWLDAELIPLATGAPRNQEQEALLYYSNLAGVQQLPLSPFEANLLRLCDGRTFPEITEEFAGQLKVDGTEVEAALFGLLSHLTRQSVLLIDWNS
jgi:L-ascorbate metabolism protein UlaG (beta-lactamase superfamily)